MVDIEATGPKYQEGDAIIQIGIVLIDGDRITKTYATDIHPRQAIPKRIEDLTGITDEQVAQAPSFSEVAPEILKLLKGRTFVAHNINFDYRILSYHLQKQGFPALNQPGLDTLELFRLAFPQAKSYQLSQLAAEEGVPLARAHQAFDDAKATADLLLRAKAKLEQLPRELKTLMTPLAPCLLRETGAYILEWVGKKPQTDDYCVKEGFALPKNLSAQTSLPIFKPEAGEKLKLWPQQVRMQEHCYQYFNSQAMTPAFLEAAYGSGKTLAALSASLKVKPTQQCWLATSTLLLQQQVYQTTGQQLANLRQSPLRVGLLKGKEHYLSLSALRAFCDEIKSQQDLKKRDALRLLAIFCWLAETRTGDLAELNRSLRVKTLLAKISGGAYFTAQHQKCWGVYSYYHLALQRTQKADVVLTNHAYLLKHHEAISREPRVEAGAHLLLDESQQFYPMSRLAQTKKADFYQLENILEHLQRLLKELPEWVGQKSSPAFDYFALVSSLQEAWEAYDRTIFAWRQEFQQLAYYKSLEPDASLSIKTWPLPSVVAPGRKLCQGLGHLESRLRELVAFQNGSKSTQLALYTEKIKRWGRTFQGMLAPEDGQYYSFEPAWERGDFYGTLYQQPLFAGEEANHCLKSWPGKVLLMSASAPGQWLKTEQAGPKMWLTWQELPAEALPTSALPKVYQLNAGTSLHQLSDLEAGARAAQILAEIWQKKTGKIMCYAPSYALLKACEARLKEIWAKDFWARIYSQSRYQNAYQLYERFEEAKEGLLLVTGPFAEGLHFKTRLDLLVLLRLPFQALDQPLEMARQQYAKSHQENYFARFALPAMLTRLGQLTGRAMTYGKKPAPILSLDRRVLESSYTAELRRVLPGEQAACPVSIAELLRLIE